MDARTRTPFGVGLGPVIVALLFLPVHFLAAAIGSTLVVEAPSAAAFWPAAGTLIAAFLLYPRNFWPYIAVAAWVAEFVAFTWFPGVFPPGRAALVGLVNLGQGLLAAWLIRRYAGERINFSRTRPTLRAAFAMFGATFIGGLIGGLFVTPAPTLVAYWVNRQTWWLSGFLGAIVMVPLILTWARHGLRPHLERSRVVPWYIALQFAVLLATLVFIFSRDTTVTPLALDSPVLVYAVLLWLVADCGPRRMTLALFLVVAVSTGFTLAGHGAFAINHPDPYLSTLKLQGNLALIVAPMLILQAVITDRSDALRTARTGEERYRSFVAQSSEAIFRAELVRPMPIHLPVDEQGAWLEKYLYIAECNASFRASDGLSDADGSLASRQPVWLQQALALVPRVMSEGGQLQNVECRLDGPYGLSRTLLVSMSTVVKDDQLQRVWGVARDVSRLRNLLEQLEQQERELRALATELTLAEERTRRKIAADLHDGLAQSLVGLKMQIAAIESAVAQSRPLPDLSAIDLTLAESLSQVRTLMTDLLPPGLYDQGLVAGLRWLVEQFAIRHRVRVEFEDDDLPKPMDESTTVIVFQAARQLMQNVARHAGTATVTMRTAVVDDRLVLTVTDSGIGFAVSEVTFRPTRQGGFGLFSIRERLKMIGGSLEIDSAPGRGTRVDVTAPLRRQAGQHHEALSA